MLDPASDFGVLDMCIVDLARRRLTTAVDLHASVANGRVRAVLLSGDELLKDPGVVDGYRQRLHEGGVALRGRRGQRREVESADRVVGDALEDVGRVGRKVEFQDLARIGDPARVGHPQSHCGRRTREIAPCRRASRPCRHRRATPHTHRREACVPEHRARWPPDWTPARTRRRPLVERWRATPRRTRVRRGSGTQ